MREAGFSQRRLIISALVLGLMTFFVRLTAAIPQNAEQEDPSQNKTTTLPAQNAQGESSTIKLNVRLVLVRVVVRDGQGRPVEKLSKEDFRILDNNKEQAITQFESEAPSENYKLPEAGGEKSPATAPGMSGITGEAKPSNALPRLLGLYFDDFAMSAADVIYARDAADRYLKKNLGPADRAAIVTASGSIAVEFTGDLKQLHEALFKLSPNGRGQNHECPEISDYQAEEIIERESEVVPPSPGSLVPVALATQLAINEAINRCNIPSESSGDLLQLVRSKAQSVLERSRMLAQYNLEGLNRLVEYLSMLPGQRNIVLVSTGFLITGQQALANAIIDRALRAQVTISSIDPRGLAVEVQEADASLGYMPTQSNLASERHLLDTARETAAGGILEEVSEGTGGKYFHNSNDLDAGFRQGVGGSEPGYILAFSPNNMKYNGSFHSLKVTLRNKPRGFTLQARRGYFAARQGPDPVAETKKEIQDMLRSRAELSGLPVALKTKTTQTAGGMELLVWAHLDIHELRFRKEGDRSANNLTFVSAIYTNEGKLVTGQERQLELNLPDDSLRQLLASGIDVTLRFRLKPARYLVREVVTDSEEHRFTAITRGVEVP